MADKKPGQPKKEPLPAEYFDARIRAGQLHFNHGLPKSTIAKRIASEFRLCIYYGVGGVFASWMAGTSERHKLILKC